MPLLVAEGSPDGDGDGMLRSSRVSGVGDSVTSCTFPGVSSGEVSTRYQSISVVAGSAVALGPVATGLTEGDCVSAISLFIVLCLVNGCLDIVAFAFPKRNWKGV